MEDFYRDKDVYDKDRGALIHFMAGHAAFRGLEDGDRAKGFLQKSLDLNSSNARMNQQVKKVLEEIDKG